MVLENVQVSAESSAIQGPVRIRHRFYDMQEYGGLGMDLVLREFGRYH